MYRALKKLRKPKHARPPPYNGTDLSNQFLWAYNHIIPTAPSLDMERKMMKRTWSFSGEIQIQTKVPIESFDDLMEILGLILDEYEGPVIKKPLVLSVYLLMGIHAKPMQRNIYSGYCYKADLNKRLSFDIYSTDFEDCDTNMTWFSTKGVGDHWFRIDFKLIIKQTIRGGQDFIEVYNSMNQNKVIPGFDQLADQFSIKLLKTDNEKFYHCL